MHEDLLAQHGIAFLKDEVFQLREECLAGRLCPENGLTTSWLGGMPRVNDEFVWPFKDGRPLNFVAQFRCSEIGVAGEGDLLFFYDGKHYGDSADDRGAFLVVRQEGTRQLTEAEHPIGRIKMLFGLFERKTRPTVWKRVGLKFEKSFSYPGPIGGESDTVLDRILEEAQERFCDGSDFTEQYHLFREEVSTPVQVGGVASPCNADEADVRATCAKHIGIAPSDAKLLLQLESVNDMAWGDAGSLCWFISKDDLARGIFENAWMVQTCH